MNTADQDVERVTVPEQGGLYWFLGGVPAAKLSLPCVECIQFLAQLTEGELAYLLRRARGEAGRRETVGEGAP